MAKKVKEVPPAPPEPKQVDAAMEITVVLNAGDIQNIMLALDEVPHKIAREIEPKLQNAVLKAIEEKEEFKEGDKEPK